MLGAMKGYQAGNLALAIAAWLLAGCDPSGRSAAPPGASGKAAASSSVADGSPASSASDTGSGPTAECEALRRRFRERLATATNGCKTAADCTCSPGGIEPAGCGRVVDSASAKALYLLYNQIREDCGLDFNCAATRCLVKCSGGHCQRDHEQTDRPQLPELTK